jgi:hypothetical protein
MSPGQAVISLLGELPNLIEHGMAATDLRLTLLGPNAKGKKRAKDGHFYRAIPFRHAVPGGGGQQEAAEAQGSKIGQNVGPAMGSAYGGVVADAKKLGRDVYRKASRLKASMGEPGTQTRWGKRLAERVGGAPLLKPHHATDIYAGMVRQEKTYKGTTQSQYTTFRTISEANPVGWIRPATEGKHLAERVAPFIEEIAPRAFEAYITGLLTPTTGAPPGAPP